MPVVLREGPYRFFFYMGDQVDPPHVHIERDNRIAKFWLNPVRLQDNGRMRRHEIRRIARIIEENQELLLEEWNDKFGH